MNRNKFAGPAILAGLPIVLFFGIDVVIGAIYDDGDTISPGSSLAILGMSLLSFFSCLGSIVWFAFALGIKTQDTVSLAQSPNEPQHSSVPLASDSQSVAVPTTIDGGYVSHVPEKIILTKSGDDKAQMVGSLIIAGSVVMFVLMIVVGFFWILSGMGSGLGGSGGTCDKTCESLGSAAKFSMWASILLFPCGVIALARPWSWFSSSEDFHSPVGKVRAGIVAGIAFIAVISFGWPALLVIGIALTIYATARRANG
jgi:hypothetical protein